MKYETIEIQKENFVATVFLNRPEVHNAMNEKLMKELTECFKNFYLDNSVRTIILTGRGKSFCAGADLNWMKSMAKYNIKENIKDSRLLSNLFESIYNCPKPVIAKINGHAFGGGLGLFAVCDISIAIPDCKFAFTIKEIKNLVNACENMDRKNYIEHTIEKIAELRVSKEGQEGINAFLEKRKSKWSG